MSLSTLVSQAIRARREAIGMSQVELAARIGRLKNSVNRTERGGRMHLRLDTLELIAAALGCTVAMLIRDAESRVFRVHNPADMEEALCE